MSVFTSITDQQLAAFLQNYSVGEHRQFSGIQAGITNTNYFVDTNDKRYVLTIVEKESTVDVEWFMQLLAYLHEHNIPCAQPLQTLSGNYTAQLANKPATLVNFLSGSDKTEVAAADCKQLGEQMAKMHLACRDYPSRRSDSRGAQWRDDTARQVMPSLDNEARQLLSRELELQKRCVLDTLPRSVIHADLFRDNVLFSGDHISGIIDVYYACDGCMIYDIAIAFNDWCRDADGRVQTLKAQTLLDGYQSVRPWHPSETACWPIALRAAALRFWLSRLQDLHFPADGALTHIKDPLIFQKILAGNAV